MTKAVFKSACGILTASIIALSCSCTLFGSGCTGFGYIGNVTETFDLSNYGVVYGTQAASKSDIEKDFYSIFPSEILPSFENVQYHYAATDYGEAYEFNLEFTIPDEIDFNTYVESVAPLDKFQVFPYDENFLEYLPCENYLCLLENADLSEEDALTFDWIDQALIKRVLINPDERRIVIVSMRVTPSLFCSNILRLDYFLKRFHIDPRQFTADYGDGWKTKEPSLGNEMNPKSYKRTGDGTVC